MGELSMAHTLFFSMVVSDKIEMQLGFLEEKEQGEQKPGKLTESQVRGFPSAFPFQSPTALLAAHGSTPQDQHSWFRKGFLPLLSSQPWPMPAPEHAAGSEA